MKITDLNQIDTSTKEGRYLLAALAILTTEPPRTDKTPDQVLAELETLKNKMDF